MFQKNAGRVCESLKGLVKCLGEEKLGAGRAELPYLGNHTWTASMNMAGESTGEGEELLAEEQIIVTWTHMHCGLASALKSHPFQVCPEVLCALS